MPDGWKLAVIVAAACAAGSLPVHAEDSAAWREQQRAFEFLKSLPHEWSRTSDHDCRTYEGKNIDRLSPSFAVAAARFLAAFIEVHGPVTITSAHRTQEEQTCVCVGEKGPCAGRPRVVTKKIKVKKKTKTRKIIVRSVSHHQLGIALDVRPGVGTEWEFKCLQEFAALNPHLGVRFPLGKHDYPHMEPALGRPGVRLASLSAASRSAAPCTTMTIMLTDSPVD
ncbi:MAG TPA: hypothetical protein VFA64_10600 [Hyphomicrobiaceae bacterium]|nr:hypothetical protein [Hyphomicrobiaceae bacterium]